jgi:hypothetical protein
MYKKLLLACMAVAAFAAFVFAPAASALTLVETTPGGIVDTVAVGSGLTAKNTGKTLFTGAFKVECEVAHLQGSVTQNNGTVAKGEIPVGSAVFTNAGGANCSSALGATKVTVTSKLCLETVSGTDTLKVTGCGGNVKFDLNVGGINCLYETASVSGTFTTNVEPATANVSEQPAKEVGGSFFCPDEGKLDMDFDLYTTSNSFPIEIIPGV